MIRTAFSLVILTAILAQALHAHLNPLDTLDQIESKLEADPNNTSLLLDKAHILIGIGRLNDSEAVLQGVDALETERSADTTYLYILLFQKRGDLDKAFELSNGGIERFPDNFYQWEIRGQISLDAGKTEEAIEALSQSLRLNTGGSSRGYIHVSNILLERNGEGDKARTIELLQDGIEKLGSPSELLHLSIRLNTELMRYDDALNNVDMLEKRYGPQVPFAIKRAEILELAGRSDEAADAYDCGIAMLNALPEEQQNKQVAMMKAMLEKAKARMLDENVEP